MKVQVNEKEQKPKYPYLGKMKSENVIVFFIDKSKGLVVNDNDFYHVGNFLSIWEEKEFEPFKGSITLSND